MSMTLMLLLMMTSCATTKITIPEKYSLDSQLERVDKVADIRVGRSQPAITEFIESFEDAQTVMARRDTVTYSESQNQWIKVDEQSFMLRGPNSYYLLVLHARALGLMSTDTISFRLLTNVIQAGADFLDLGGIRYLIERIYKIDSTQQMLSIKSQLTKKQDNE
jgi:hypothetical protein